MNHHRMKKGRVSGFWGILVRAVRNGAAVGSVLGLTLECSLLFYMSEEQI
jgi:hypothetical protein